VIDRSVTEQHSLHVAREDPTSLYHDKLRTLPDAIALVRPDDVLGVPIATGQPAAFLHALGSRDDYTDLHIFGGLLVEPYPVLQRSGVRLISGFYGPVERMLQAAGVAVQYLPADFLGWERYALRLKPRVMVSTLAPMDDNGFFSFGLHSGATFRPFLEAAGDPDRLAIGEVVADMPRILGVGRYGGHRIHVSEIDYLVESDRNVFELPPEAPSEEDAMIARHVERLIEDGATLQIGIGGVPNIVAQLLAEGDKGDFGVHTELLVDGVMHLHRAGRVSNRKGIYDGFSVATFAAGSRDLYRWMDGNPAVRLLPVAQVNDPAIIRRNRLMVSINGALAVDLSGQVMADTLGARQYSGVGGHELFVVGARASPGGKSLICLRSTARSAGERVSTIVAQLPTGTPVTTPRHHVQYVITEHGVADLGMLHDRDRRHALIEIAHPDFRDHLRAEVAGQ
jgi:acyl-CoA hydrolase